MKNNYNVFWLNLHDWGKQNYKDFKLVEKDFYTQIQYNFDIS